MHECNFWLTCRVAFRIEVHDLVIGLSSMSLVSKLTKWHIISHKVSQICRLGTSFIIHWGTFMESIITIHGQMTPFEVKIHFFHGRKLSAAEAHGSVHYDGVGQTPYFPDWGINKCKYVSLFADCCTLYKPKLKKWEKMCVRIYYDRKNVNNITCSPLFFL